MTHLNAVVAKRVAKQLLKTSAVEQLFNEQLARAVLGHTDALQKTLENASRKSHRDHHLLNDVRTEFLHRKRADVASELANNGIAEAVVIQIQNILDNLVTN